MIGKQINFYITENDIALIDSYLSKNDFIILNEIQPEKVVPATIQSLRFFPDESITHKYLTLNSLFPEVKAKPMKNPLLANRYYVDIFSSPVIEYSPCLYDFEDSHFKAGRFYILKNIRQDGDNVPQNEELMLKFEEFTNWFKSQFKKQKDGQFARFYVSKEMVKLAKNRNVELVLR